jgi:putative PIN family toxin of toxin-antitoxin system
LGATETEMRRAGRRVVLDTNVVASALLFPGPTTAALRRAWKSGEIVPLVCRETTLELMRVLAYPRFALTDEEIEQFVADYLPFTEVVAVADGPPLGPKCRDPDDQIFVELAIAGRAE